MESCFSSTSPEVVQQMKFLVFGHSAPEKGSTVICIVQWGWFISKASVIILEKLLYLLVSVKLWYFLQTETYMCFPLTEMCLILSTDWNIYVFQWLTHVWCFPVTDTWHLPVTDTFITFSSDWHVWSFPTMEISRLLCLWEVVIFSSSFRESVPRDLHFPQSFIS